MPVAIGGIVVREIFLAGGGRSSTFKSWYWSCNRTGEAPDGSAGRTEHDYVVGGYALFPHKEGPEAVDHCGTRGSTELLCSGGPGGHATLARSRRSEGNTPRPRRGSSSSVVAPDLVQTGKRLEAGDDKRPQEKQEEIASREDRVDHALRSTPRATIGGRRRVFSCGFPRLV